jgi:putative inorganic carbon (HCO3(-)) transporter
VVLVPLVVDPLGADTLALKRLVLALLGLAVLAAEGAAVLRRRQAVPVPSVFEVLLLALATWAALSLTWAPNPAAGVEGVLVLLGMLGVVRGVAAAVAAGSPPGRWIAALLTVAVVALLLDGTAILVHRQQLDASAEKFASWLFLHNNMAAVYVAMLAPLAVALAATRRGVAQVALVGSLLALIGYLLLLRSRAGLLAVLLAIPGTVLLLVLRSALSGARALPRGTRLAIGLVVVLLALAPLSARARGLAKDAFYRGVNVLDTLGISDLSDASFRMQLFARTMEMVRERPVLGVGEGNFAVVYPRYEPLRGSKPHAHDDALQVLSELGLPGLLLFLGLLGAFAAAVLAMLTGAGPPARQGLGAGLAGALVVFAVCGVFEVPFVLGATAANLAVLLGLSAGAAGARPRSRVVPRGAGGLVLLAALAGCGLAVQRMPASLLLARARARAAAGDGAGAERDYSLLAGLGTGSYLPEAELARLALADGDPETALLHVHRARALWPYGVDLLQLEGGILGELGRWSEAVDRLQQALAIKPGLKEVLFRLVQALARDGRLQEGIDLLEYEVQSDREAGSDLLLLLARLWADRAEELEGPERVEALVASRHFYAELLQDGPADRMAAADKEYAFITHQLQSLPGAPDSWWKEVYMPWLRHGGWRMPNTALWTHLGPGGVRIYPGWDERAGPPLPRTLR